MFNTNTCDGIYNDFQVHFTSACPNKCFYCVDKLDNSGFGIIKPDINKIVKTIISNSKGMEEVLFVGGEPCLFLDDLIECIKLIKKNTSLKCYVTTSIPQNCYDNYDKFLELIDCVDILNISVQHYKETIADQMRGTVSNFNRQEFYKNLPHKNKIRICFNLIKSYLDTKEDILNCVQHYNQLGFNNIKIGELFGQPNYFISFENIMGIKLKSPFSHNCNTIFDIHEYIPSFNGTLTLRRTCFLSEESLDPSFLDGVKCFYRLLFKPKGKHYIIYENGLLTTKWVNIKQ